MKNAVTIKMGIDYRPTIKALMHLISIEKLTIKHREKQLKEHNIQLKELKIKLIEIRNLQEEKC